PPGPGEQYRFHLDMTQCIGCRCCEVACNEQNNNPFDIRWRRVGEIEGGSYPMTERLYLSMGCNHCLEPACLIGCPVDAYTKDEATGLVFHSADQCIGCQYCTWNCPYGVPQYNPERGVVGKCDMCYGRLSEGLEPACVDACPQGAIRVETVNIDEWKQQYHESANAPGLPAADHTISTTRITLPDELPINIEKADSHRVRPEQPHGPLILMTVLTQFSVGAFASVWLLSLFGHSAIAKFAALAALGVGFLSLGASTLHLGRPIHTYRALRMWKRSWLSREVLLFSLFSFAACVYAAALWMGLGVGAGRAAGALAVLLGLAGVTASARIYLVPARPAWNSRHTIAEFYFTGLLLGPLFIAALGERGLPFALIAALAAAGQLLNQGLKLLRLIRSDEFELKASARLLSKDLEKFFLLRLALLALGGILLPLADLPAVALPLALAGELLGRYLFFVSVVPKNMAATFISGERRVA
ncbi:MAG: DmsC/YnfH family molybdoenzyme membrane anchor subunit, partial [Terriglobia bacterium]